MIGHIYMLYGLLTTGPASKVNSFISALDPTGTNMRIRCVTVSSLHVEREELRVRLAMIRCSVHRCVLLSGVLHFSQALSQCVK